MIFRFIGCICLAFSSTACMAEVLSDPDGVFEIGGAIDGDSKVTLEGVTRDLVIKRKIDGNGILDASKLGVYGEIRFDAKIDGKANVIVKTDGKVRFASRATGIFDPGSKIDGNATVKIISAKEVEFASKVDGQSSLEVSAQRVIFSDPLDSEFTGGSKVDGRAQVNIICGKELTFKSKIDGNAKVSIVCKKGAKVVLEDKIDGEAQVVIARENADDPVPDVIFGYVGPNARLIIK